MPRLRKFSLKPAPIILSIGILLTAVAAFSGQLVSLDTIRGGRHKDFASIVFQFSDRSDYTEPRIHSNEIHFTFPGAATSLKLFRKYKTFDSYVKIDGRGEHIDVRMGIPQNFKRMSAFQLENPHRFVVNLYIKEQPTVTGTVRDELPPTEKAVSEPGENRKPVVLKDRKTRTAPEAPEDRRQMDLIEARILNRKGLHEKSLELLRFKAYRRKDRKGSLFWP